jgi:spore coat protein A
MDDASRIKPQLGTVANGALKWEDPITEFVKLGNTEVWEFYNTTPDAHPIHLHETSFQILNRQKFTATQLSPTAPLTNINLLGQPKLPAANEAGWKDTVVVNPGEVARIVAKFDLPGEYVWHCHILSHEDHEMMRPYQII